MTAGDVTAFAECYDRLARAQGGSVEPDTIRAYFETLKDLSLEAVESAALTLARTGGEFFPRAAKWHELARMDARAIVERYVHSSRAEPWHYECEDCHDVGWLERWVEQGEMTYSQVQRCEIPARYRHQVARVCPCRPTNRSYQRMHPLVEGEGHPRVSPVEAKRTLERVGWRR